MSLRHVFSPSGGLAYHFIARRRASHLWRGFRASVRGWLEPWLSDVRVSPSSPPRQLIVFGPSAGWTLPLDLFRGFRVLFVEPDPVAAWLLRRRLKAAGVRDFEISGRADILPWCAKRGAFANFLSQHPNASLLFANVLGQMPLVASRTDGVREEFLDALRGRRWASYHDLFSGSSDGARGLRTEHAAASELQEIARNVFSSGDVIDHEMEWLGSSISLALWPLTEKSLHVIGFAQADN